MGVRHCESSNLFRALLNHKIPPSRTTSCAWMFCSGEIVCTHVWTNNQSCCFKHKHTNNRGNKITSKSPIQQDSCMDAKHSDSSNLFRALLNHTFPPSCTISCAWRFCPEDIVSVQLWTNNPQPCLKQQGKQNRENKIRSQSRMQQDLCTGAKYSDSSDFFRAVLNHKIPPSCTISCAWRVRSGDIVCMQMCSNNPQPCLKQLHKKHGFSLHRQFKNTTGLVHAEQEPWVQKFVS